MVGVELPLDKPLVAEGASPLLKGPIFASQGVS